MIVVGVTPMEIHRSILPIIEKSLDEYSVALITGARQVGNTTLAPNVFAYPMRLYSRQ